MVEKKLFDTLDGQEVYVYTISNEQMEVELIPFGAAIRAIRVPDRDGKLVDVCLGYDDVASYRKLSACLGGTLGRCANRIGGASFKIDDKEYKVPANEGKNCLHGGLVGFHKKLWKTAKALENFVVFDLLSRDGEEGFPGNLNVRVTYRLEGTTLSMDYEALTDQDTIVNMTNHTYFNLAGHNGGIVADHEVLVRAETYTPSGEGNIPTGEIRGVEGTPLDLRQSVILGERLGDPFLAASHGYDHNLVLSQGKQPAAELYCPRTGIALEVQTTQEGMQFYTAGWLTERTGKDDTFYGPAHGVCFESQHFPNAINCPGFPSPILRAGDTYRATTSWHFFTK